MFLPSPHLSLLLLMYFNLFVIMFLSLASAESRPKQSHPVSLAVFFDLYFYWKLLTENHYCSQLQLYIIGCSIYDTNFQRYTLYHIRYTVFDSILTSLLTDHSALITAFQSYTVYGIWHTAFSPAKLSFRYFNIIIFLFQKAQ